MIDRDNKRISISRQAKLLGINRSGLYYKPVRISDEEYRIKRIIDEVYTAHPEYSCHNRPGSKRMYAYWMSRVKMNSHTLALDIH